MADNEINESEQASSDSSPDSQEQVVPKPGARLAEYREKAGMTVEQVASRLKMTNRQVQQIEADNYESMYSMAIARGFIRAYAKLLNVDGEPLAAMLPADKPGISLPVQPKRGAHESFIGKRQSFRSGRAFPGRLIGMLAAVLIIVVALMAWRGGWLPSFSKVPVSKDLASQELQSRKNVSKEAPQKEKAAATGSVSTELAAPKTTVITEESQKLANDPAQGAAQAGQSVSASSAAAPAVSSSSEQASVTKPESATSVAHKSKGALFLRARQDSWVQILRSDSTVLYERTLKPGQTETLEIREPVAVTIGYAPGMEATFRGSRLELKTAEGSTVARLNLK